MKRMKWTEFRAMRVKGIWRGLPIEVTADGEVLFIAQGVDPLSKLYPGIDEEIAKIENDNEEPG